MFAIQTCPAGQCRLPALAVPRSLPATHLCSDAQVKEKRKEAMEEEEEEELKKKSAKKQALAVSMEPANGYTRALVGVASQLHRPLATINPRRRRARARRSAGPPPSTRSSRSPSPSSAGSCCRSISSGTRPPPSILGFPSSVRLRRRPAFSTASADLIPPWLRGCVF